MAAALYGLAGAELRERLPEIIAFADIGDYIDEPVKHYSSGMVVRLGFAVVAALKPDLLITDEVLAVGDESFQKKCVRWMEDYLADGGTLILVSHSMYHVQKLCRHACWLRGGEVAMAGDVFDVTQAYLAYHERKAAPLRSRCRDRARGPRIQRARRRAQRRRRRGADLLLEHGATLRVRARIRSRDGRVPVRRVRHRARRRHAGVRRQQRHGRRARRSASARSEYVVRDRIRRPAAAARAATPCACTRSIPKACACSTRVERGVVVRGASREFGLVRLARIAGDDPTLRWRRCAIASPTMMTDPTARLPFTGERFTPECVREIWYEHWHRYAFARRARGRQARARRRLRRRLRLGAARRQWPPR